MTISEGRGGKIREDKLPSVSIIFIRVANAAVIASMDYEWGVGVSIGHVFKVISYSAGCWYANRGWCEHGRLNVQEKERTIMVSFSASITCFSPFQSFSFSLSERRNAIPFTY